VVIAEGSAVNSRKGSVQAARKSTQKSYLKGRKRSSGMQKVVYSIYRNRSNVYAATQYRIQADSKHYGVINFGRKVVFGQTDTGVWRPKEKKGNSHAERTHMQAERYYSVRKVSSRTGRK
jgi:hypothetical protein